MNGTCLGVMANTLYNIPALGAPTPIGDVALDNNQAQIVSGPRSTQFLIASGGNGYCWTPSTSTFTQVLTHEVTQIGMLDAFGVRLNADDSSLAVSAANDFTTWDPALFVQRTDAPDNWIAMTVNIPDVWLLGEQTGVVWYDAGAFPFPLAQRPGATFKFGIVAPWTLKTAGGFVLWLSRNAEGAGIVVMAVGYSPQRISTSEVETAIAGYARTSRIDDAEALMFQFYGHVFYVLTFPSAGATWVYDVLTGQWVEWGKWNSALTRYDIWSPRVHGYAFGQHLVAERGTGRISVLDPTVSTESDGTYTRRMRIAPAIFNEMRPIPIRKLEVLLETGLGTLSGQGVDPHITLAISDDGGKTYLPEQPASAGRLGAYLTRVTWMRLGVPRNRVNRFVMTDPVPWRLVDAFINNDEPIGRAA
jgi:hypothetical protein